MRASQNKDVYKSLLYIFDISDQKYNSGLFDNKDDISRKLTIDDKVLKNIINELYETYSFEFVPLDILGSIYERFLGDAIQFERVRPVIETKPEVICFYVGNISPVLENLTAKYPQKTFIIAGDNDAHKEQNTGKIKSEEASKKFGLKVILPKFKDISTNPTDWNDLYILEGEAEVQKQLEWKGLKIINIAELLQYDIPQKEALLEPILHEGSLAMIYAKRGVGKTFASLEVAFTVASGGSMFDGR